MLNVGCSGCAYPLPVPVRGCSPPTPQESRARWRRWGSSGPRRLRQHRGLNSAEVAVQYLSASADGMALQPLGKMPGWGPPGAIPRLPPSLGSPGPVTLPGAVPAGAAQPASHSSVQREPCPRRGAGGGGVQMPPHYSSVNIKHHCLTNEEKPLPSE